MSKRSILKRLLIFGLCYSQAIQADSFGEPQQIQSIADSSLTQINGPAFSCFNTQTNQFFLPWKSDSNNYIYCNFYDTQAHQIGSSLGIVNQAVLNQPTCCYNSKNNQFLITYLAQSDSRNYPYFNILDEASNSIIGPVQIPNYTPSDADQANSLAFCCYNSINNQYVITWGSLGYGYGICYFAVINADGSIAINTTEITDSRLSTAGGYNVAVSYLANENRYCFSWQDYITRNPYFAIYNNDGTVFSAARAANLSMSFNGVSTIVASSFNSKNNTYLITANDEDGNGYGWLYINDDSSPLLTFVNFYENLFPNIGGNCILSSFSPTSNQFFLTSQNIDYNSQCLVLDENGSYMLLSTIPNPSGVVDDSFVTNSYSATTDSFFISWTGPLIPAYGYYTIYTKEPVPPQNLAGQQLLNRFANYGEYYNQLSWTLNPLINIESYWVYRNGERVAVLPNTQNSYVEHNQQPHTPVTYRVLTQNVNGLLSDPSEIVIG